MVKALFFTDKVNAGTLGMKTLLERTRIIGGSIHIDSGQGQGTKVELTVPLEGSSKSA